MRFALPALFFLSGCMTPGPSEAQAQIDHVIIGVPDLEQAIKQIADLTGVRPVVGGVHPGRGTRNALMSLGDGSYLEILAPNPAEPVPSGEATELGILTEPTPIGWAVSAEDETELRRRLSKHAIAVTPAEPGSRDLPNGSTLRWVTFGYSDLDDPLAPFFIIWADPTRHPSRTSPSGCRLTELRIQHPNADRVARAVAPLQVPVAVSPSTKSGMRVTLTCPRGTLTFG